MYEFNFKTPFRQHSISQQLINFLYLYGMYFSNSVHGISVRGQGFYFNRRGPGTGIGGSMSSEGEVGKYVENSLCVEDPQLTHVDIGKTCFNYPKVKREFKNAYSLLTLPYVLFDEVKLMKIKMIKEDENSNGDNNNNELHTSYRQIFITPVSTPSPVLLSPKSKKRTLSQPRIDLDNNDGEKIVSSDYNFVSDKIPWEVQGIKEISNTRAGQGVQEGGMSMGVRKGGNTITPLGIPNHWSEMPSLLGLLLLFVCLSVSV
jgi:DNA polymerase sigma